jgi:DNA phosphorothioation-dependent restriction protein DptH
MREQVDNTQVRLRELFDPDLFPLPRADFALRAKELGTALSFYVRRAIRYGLLAQTAGDAALDIIEKLDQGYKLDIRLLGVVFERAGRGAHEDEEEPGFQVYRFGGDVAQEFV